MEARRQCRDAHASIDCCVLAYIMRAGGGERGRSFAIEVCCVNCSVIVQKAGAVGPDRFTIDVLL